MPAILKSRALCDFVLIYFIPPQVEVYERGSFKFGTHMS